MYETWGFRILQRAPKARRRRRELHQLLRFLTVSNGPGQQTPAAEPPRSAPCICSSQFIENAVHGETGLVITNNPTATVMCAGPGLGHVTCLRWVPSWSPSESLGSPGWKPEFTAISPWLNGTTMADTQTSAATFAAAPKV